MRVVESPNGVEPHMVPISTLKAVECLPWNGTKMTFQSVSLVLCSFPWTGRVIIVWSTGSFYRAAIPKDITSGAPNPSEWGKPSATLQASQCNIGKFFSNHSIIFGEQLHYVCTRDFLTNTTQTLHFAVSLHGVVIRVSSERKCRRLGREFICYFGMPWNLRREIDGSKELCGNTNFPLRDWNHSHFFISECVVEH